MDFGPFQDDDDEAKFPKLCLPKYSPKQAFCSESLKLMDLNPFDNDYPSMFPTFRLPVDSQERNANGALYFEYHKTIEALCGVSSSTSCGGATASASCYNSVSVKSYMNEEDAVDSLPQPLHQDKNGEVNDHAVKCQSSEISNSYNKTTDNNDEASRPDASVDLQNFSNSIEMDYNEEPSQPDENEVLNDPAVKCQSSEISNSYKETTVNNEEASRLHASIDPQNFSNSNEMDSSEKTSTPDDIEELNDHAVKCQSSEISNSYKETTVNNEEASRPDATSRPLSSAGGQNISLKSHNSRERYRVKSFTVPEFFVEVPESTSVGFLKKAIWEEATKMVDELLRWENTRYENGFIPKVGTSHENKLDDGCISSMTATTYSKVVLKRPMGPAPQKSKSSKNEKRRKIEPFSISEVEALVQKIEEYGTGRWAKIKEQAFGQDSRRTRMDLRDKWDRLLKTTKTPPEKRRGPKIPQVLLDRVVAIDKCNSQC